jgi:hypothetical protein
MGEKLLGKTNPYWKESREVGKGKPLGWGEKKVFFPI